VVFLKEGRVLYWFRQRVVGRTPLRVARRNAVENGSCPRMIVAFALAFLSFSVVFPLDPYSVCETINHRGTTLWLSALTYDRAGWTPHTGKCADCFLLLAVDFSRLAA
jgi:hypothetical protein